jgi:hypothetical protein
MYEKEALFSRPFFRARVKGRDVLSTLNQRSRFSIARSLLRLWGAMRSFWAPNPDCASVTLCIVS